MVKKKPNLVNAVCERPLKQKIAMLNLGISGLQPSRKAICGYSVIFYPISFSAVSLTTNMPKNSFILFFPEKTLTLIDKHDLNCTHHLGMNNYVNFLGRLGSNGFQLI